MAKVSAQADEHISKSDLVSIIMPVFNRQRFLADAIDAICKQSYSHWELIVVDDGSFDDSVKILAELTQHLPNRVLIIEQENAGPAAARNRGFTEAQGQFVAFYDSDDLWKAHHLSSCIAALQNHQSLSWIYSACERVDYFTGELILKSTFYTNENANPLFACAQKHEDGTFILHQDQAVKVQLNEGLDNGFQNSMLRREVLEKHLIPDFRVGEDRLFILMALKSGFGMGFIDKINVTYRVHDQNISDTNVTETDIHKRIASLSALIAAKEQLVDYVSLNEDELKVYRKKLADELFWELGYSLQQSNGLYSEAQRSYKRAMSLVPFNLKYFKTYLGLLLKKRTHSNTTE